MSNRNLLPATVFGSAGVCGFRNRVRNRLCVLKLLREAASGRPVARIAEPRTIVETVAGRIQLLAEPKALRFASKCLSLLRQNFVADPFENGQVYGREMNPMNNY